MRAILLPIGADNYAVPVDWVRQVAAAPPVTRLVTAPSPVLGLFNLRGEIVPLLDTAALLGVGRMDDIAYAVVVTCPKGPAGLATSHVPERIELDTATGMSELPGTAGTFRVGDRVVVLLDPSALLDDGQLGASGSRAATPAGVS
jgi:chemotaxis signal transduction protein